MLPVVVTTAKELTMHDRIQLDESLEHVLLQRGAFQCNVTSASRSTYPSSQGSCLWVPVVSAGT
jgi:hypothetical protein